MKEFLKRAGEILVLTGAMLYVGYQWFGGQLAEARRDAHLANQEAQFAMKAQAAAWEYASYQLARAENAETRAVENEKKASVARAIAEEKVAESAALPPAPDTCAKWIEPLTVARDSARAAADHWQAAYGEQKEATGALRAALDSVETADDNLVEATENAVEASETLVKETGKSFWKQLLSPKVNVNLVTFNPATRDLIAEPTIGLGWSISL
jgi:hypothetical protein